MIDKITEMLRSSMPEVRELGRTLKAEENLKRRLNFDLIRKIQVDNPHAILAGSAALYLYGVRIGRFKDETSQHDIDLVMPFYQPITPIKGYDAIPITKPSANDFDYAMHYPGGIHIDVKVDPKALYNKIELDGFIHKVVFLEDIIAAKCKYSKMSNDPLKHKKDIYDMLGVTLKLPKEDEEPHQWNFSQGS